MHRLFLNLSSLVLYFLLNSTTNAEARVTVHTHDQRVLEGQVDSRTDDTQLWIRHEEEDIVLVTPIAWSQIVGATIGDEPADMNSFATKARSLATPEPELLLAEYPVAKPIVLSHGLVTNRPMRITSAQVEAILVNRDRDVEPDGIELLVATLDTVGHPVPIRGTLSVRLWGERIRSTGQTARFETFQRWSQRVEPTDFVEGVASYFLPFRTVRPARDLSVHPEAIVHARLGVFGQGNYEASAPVALRHFNPVRDRLQQHEGHRYFRGELTGAEQKSIRAFSH